MVSQRTRDPAHSRFSRPWCSYVIMSRSDQLGASRSPWHPLLAGSVPGAHGFRPCAVFSVCPLALVRALPCPSGLRLDVGRFWSARAALPLTWQSSAAPRLRRSALASLAPASARRPLLPSSRNRRIPRAPSALPHCPRFAVRLPICTRPPPSRLIRILLAPLRLGGAAVTNAVDAHAESSMWREIQPQARRRFSTTWATPDCCCAPTPSSRLRCHPASRSLMSSRSSCRVALRSTSGRSCNKTIPLPIRSPTREAVPLL